MPGSAAFLPARAVARLLAPGTDARFSGPDTLSDMPRNVDGGCRLNGKWSHGSVPPPALKVAPDTNLA